MTIDLSIHEAANLKVILRLQLIALKNDLADLPDLAESINSQTASIEAILAKLEATHGTD